MSRRTLVCLVGAVIAVVLGWLASSHPELRLVDAIGFGARAHRLATGDPSAGMNPLYPIGYPLLLWAGKLALGDVLVAAKVASALAGTGLAVLVAARVSPWAGLAMLGCPALLNLASQEGTDLPAAASVIGGILLLGGTPGTPDRPTRGAGIAAGFLLGLGCLFRYTAWVSLPVIVAWAALDAWRWAQAARRGGPAAPGGVPTGLWLLPGLGCSFGVHFAGAAWAGVAPWPDQGMNLMIAAGHQTRLWSMDTLLRWPAGFSGAALHATMGGVGLLGLLGLGVAALRGDRRGTLLFGVAFSHVAALGIAFSDPRLVAPASISLYVGIWLGISSLGSAPPASPVRRLAPWAQAAGLVVAAAAGAWQGSLLAGHQEGRAVMAVVEANVTRPCVTTSPWFFHRHEGWTEPPLSVRKLGPLGRRVGPDELARALDRADVHCIALERDRALEHWPGLAPMLEEGDLPGWSLRAAQDGWWVWERVREDG